MKFCIMLERGITLGLVHRRAQPRRLEFDAHNDEDKSHHVLLSACNQRLFNFDMPWTMCAANRFFDLVRGRRAARQDLSSLVVLLPELNLQFIWRL